MTDNKLYSFFRGFVIVLILLFTFLLPLKFNGIVGIPEVTGFFPEQIFAYLIITWPVFLFPFVAGFLLLLSLLVFPLGNLSFKKNPTLIVATLWGLLAFTSLFGAINATVWDFVIMQISHLFGLAAYALTIYLLLKNISKARTLLFATIIAGLVITIWFGLEQYLLGFEEMQEYIVKQEKIGKIASPGALKALIFDNRLHAPFTSSNSLAGYLLLTMPLCLLMLWKFCGRVEPPKLARLIFVPIVAAVLFFVFFATRARGAFLALILTTGVFIVFLPIKKYLRVSIMVLVILATAGGVFYIHRFGRGFESMLSRIDYILVSTKLLLKQPLFGTGWGDFFYDYMRLKTVQSQEAAHTPHNLFMAIGGQAGIFALLTAIGALFYPFWLGAKKVVKLLGEHNYTNENIALLFGLIAFIFHAMIDVDLQVPALMSMVIVTTLLLVMPNKAEETKQASRRLIAYPLAIIVALIALLGGWHLTRSEYVFSKLTDTCSLRGKTPKQVFKISPSGVNEKLEAILKQRPYSPFPYATAGAFYFKTRRFDRAKFCYNEALKIVPNSAAYHFRLFYLYRIEGNNEEAKKHLLKASEFFPNHPKYKLVKEKLINE